MGKEYEKLQKTLDVIDTGIRQVRGYTAEQVNPKDPYYRTDLVEKAKSYTYQIPEGYTENEMVLFMTGAIMDREYTKDLKTSSSALGGDSNMHIVGYMDNVLKSPKDDRFDEYMENVVTQRSRMQTHLANDTKEQRDDLFRNCIKEFAQGMMHVVPSNWTVKAYDNTAVAMMDEALRVYADVKAAGGSGAKLMEESLTDYERCRLDSRANYVTSNMKGIRAQEQLLDGNSAPNSDARRELVEQALVSRAFEQVYMDTVKHDAVEGTIDAVRIGEKFYEEAIPVENRDLLNQNDGSIKSFLYTSKMKSGIEFNRNVVTGGMIALSSDENCKAIQEQLRSAIRQTDKYKTMVEAPADAPTLEEELASGYQQRDQARVNDAMPLILPQKRIPEHTDKLVFSYDPEKIRQTYEQDAIDFAGEDIRKATENYFFSHINTQASVNRSQLYGDFFEQEYGKLVVPTHVVDFDNNTTDTMDARTVGSSVMENHSVYMMKPDGTGFYKPSLDPDELITIEEKSYMRDDTIINADGNGAEAEKVSVPNGGFVYQKPVMQETDQIPMPENPDVNDDNTTKAWLLNQKVQMRKALNKLDDNEFAKAWYWKNSEQYKEMKSAMKDYETAIDQAIESGKSLMYDDEVQQQLRDSYGRVQESLHSYNEHKSRQNDHSKRGQARYELTKELSAAFDSGRGLMDQVVDHQDGIARRFYEEKIKGQAADHLLEISPAVRSKFGKSSEQLNDWVKNDPSFRKLIDGKTTQELHQMANKKEGRNFAEDLTNAAAKNVANKQAQAKPARKSEPELEAPARNMNI